MSQISSNIFKSNLLHLGLFRCHRDNDYFTDTGPIPNHLLVFPRTSVCIQHYGNPAVLASPNVVMFYNKHQQYQRYPVSPEGDVCEWFAFEPALIIEALAVHDPAVCERFDTPFTFTLSPSNAHSYLQQRSIVEHCLTPSPTDTLYVETTALAVLEQTLEYTYQAQYRGQSAQSNKTKKAHQALVYEAQAKLALDFQEPLSLTNLALYLHTSVYHLCRIFRKYTGYTLQQYLDQIRLRTALDSILHTHTPLTNLAHDLGYTHHSHFTLAFRRAFGMPPSTLRNKPNSFRQKP